MTENKLTDISDAEIDRLLAETGRDVPVADPALMARVLEDAYEVATELEQLSAPRPEPARGMARQKGLVALLALIGGWPALAGLATAAVAGVWIGYAAPETLPGLSRLGGVGAAGQAGYDFGDFTAAYDDLLGEG